MAFIVFEGLDGAGKSTLMKRLYQELQEKGYRVVSTREPGGTPLGEEIRRLILANQDAEGPLPRTELLLYEASRAEHVGRVIVPALNQGSWVLCDRFSASSIAFQAGGRGIETQEVGWLNAFATSNLEPHLTVLLDLSVEESRRRQGERFLKEGSGPDRMESEGERFHQAVRNSFLAQAKAAKPGAWLVLDAQKKPEALAAELLAYLDGVKWFL